jgi:hypothetical protein
MSDLILSIFLIAGTYVCSTGFAIVLFRMFFPLKTKSVEMSKLTFTTNTNKWRNVPAKTKVQLFSISGKRDLVKMGS